MAKTLNFDRRPTFTLSREDEATLIEAARKQGYSKSKLIRELIRGNMSMQNRLKQRRKLFQAIFDYSF